MPPRLPFKLKLGAFFFFISLFFLPAAVAGVHAGALLSKCGLNTIVGKKILHIFVEHISSGIKSQCINVPFFFFKYRTQKLELTVAIAN